MHPKKKAAAHCFAVHQHVLVLILVSPAVLGSASPWSGLSDNFQQTSLTVPRGSGVLMESSESELKWNHSFDL